MRKFRTVIAFVLAMLLTLTACGQKAETPVQTTAPAAVETTAPVPAEPVNVMVLNGTTGFGMANLMDAAAKGEAAQDYNFTVETDASNIVAALANGSVDIAALPTNAAAALRW